MDVPVILTAIFIIIGVILIVSGIFQCFKVSNLILKCTYETEGVMDRSNLKPESTLPLYMYTVEGVKYEIKSEKIDFKKNLKVLYNPDKPSEHYEVGKKPAYTSGLITMIVGFLFLIFIYWFQN